MGLVLVGGCSNSSTATPDAAVTVIDAQSPDTPNLPSNTQVDVLFVIPTSTSTGTTQSALITAFPAFLAELAGTGALPDLHIGVTTADVGDGPYATPGCVGAGTDGLLQTTAHPVPPAGSCPTPTDLFLSDAPAASGSGRDVNYPGGSLSDAFACIALLGTNGCPWTQPLEATRRALQTNPGNTGFLRSTAILAVIYVANKDDCSAQDTMIFDPAGSALSLLGALEIYRCTYFGVTCAGAFPKNSDAGVGWGTDSSCVARGDSYLWDPQHYVTFLRSLKADPSKIIVGVVGGAPAPVVIGPSSGTNDPMLDPSCTTGFAAQPDIRLDSVAAQFGGSAGSGCDAAAALSSIADRIRAAGP
jgi:hypothetical protein